MQSKFQRQKQIFALLNSRFPEEFLASEAVRDESGSGLPSKNGNQLELLVQVYQFYKSIIQNINFGLLTIDLQGEITFANKSAANLLKTRVKTLLGRNVKSCFADAAEGEKFRKIVSLPGKEINEREYRFARGDGSSLIINLNAAPLHDLNNNFEGMVLLFRDMTEVHQLRSQVERMERLALLGELSAGIAHEIRNPLAGIKTAAQVLEESFSQDDFQRQLTGRIVREVNKANNLLTDFFKFARPTRPKPDFHNLEMIVDSVYLLLAPRMKSRNIKFQENFGNQVPQVYVDESQVEQVVLNLFLNAIDAMEEGGTLSVTTSKKQVTLLEEREKQGNSSAKVQYVVVEISDTGSGISEEQFPRIFNPFYTTKSDGLGLGLSICSRLVEENHGKIDCRSTPGEGTTFQIALPAFNYRL